MEEARSHIQSANEEDFLEQFCLLQAGCNAYLAYDAGIFKVDLICLQFLSSKFQILCEILLLEANDATDENSPFVERGSSAMSNTRSASSTDTGSAAYWESKKKMPTLTENEMLRLILNAQYHMIESIRRADVLSKCTHVSDYSASRLEQLQQQFVRELRKFLGGFMTLEKKGSQGKF
jgi:hypothetical protein